MKNLDELWHKLAKDLRRRDPKLLPLIDAIGPPKLRREADPFRALVESILSQQLAPKAAATIIERFKSLSPPFPKPEVILSMPRAKLRRAGLSRQKLSYLCSLSERWEDRNWRRGWSNLSDAELSARLVEVKGIGEWTAHMFLIFSLQRPNVLPTGDYGIRRGVQLLNRLEELPKPSEIPTLVQAWEGAYSIGSWYIWAALDRKLL